MSQTPIRVVKVGGSLLDLPDLADRIRHWLAAQSAAHHILIAGGGPLADQMRQWHQQRPIREASAHWMCIDLMTVTAHLLHDRMPEIPLIEDDRLLCQRVGDRSCTIFGVGPWMRESESHLPGTRLPATWEVSSDSIAGRLAIVLGATELVLLKSALPPNDKLDHLSNTEYVDPMFSRLAAELPPIRPVNLKKGYPQIPPAS
ncbi:MAG: hypothetical protein MK171_07550 [Pirellulales bacterium]|nr:hypothetical protein [Pirellulales bacterium]